MGLGRRRRGCHLELITRTPALPSCVGLAGLQVCRALLYKAEEGTVVEIRGCGGSVGRDGRANCGEEDRGVSGRWDG